MNTLIIGGMSTFGQAIAKDLKQKNHQLALTYFDNVIQVEELAHSLQVKELFLVDVTSKAQVKQCVHDLSLPVDNVIYSVGLPLSFTPVDTYAWEEVEKHIHSQVQGLLLFIQQLRKNNHPLKRIIAFGSSVTLGTPPGRLLGYTVSKYALLGLVRSLAVELAAAGTTVNMVSPGATGFGLSSTYPDILLELTQKQTPLKRLVTTEDVVAVVSFLLSPEAGYVTGLNIPLDGGIHM